LETNGTKSHSSLRCQYELAEYAMML
jgi:hypothetical protein